MPKTTNKKPKRKIPMTPIRRHRHAMGKSAEDCAKHVGVSKLAWYRWENGEVEPSAQYYPKIAEALGITTLELTELVSPSQPAAA